MDFELNERDLIYLLNCMSLTLNFMKWHNPNEKSYVEMYFYNENYADDYNSIMVLHRFMSLKGNRVLYNLEDDIFFRGQAKYLIHKNFDFLKSKYKHKHMIKRNVKNIKYKKEINSFIVKLKVVLYKIMKIV
ncbi:MAG: hypothetical protein PHP54_03795 [Clostridia bacterium]|nr:hypothetical protein [Clostridia bacterium]